MVLKQQVATLNSQMSRTKQELDDANHRSERLLKVKLWLMKVKFEYMYPLIKVI